MNVWNCEPNRNMNRIMQKIIKKSWGHLHKTLIFKLYGQTQKLQLRQKYTAMSAVPLLPVSISIEYVHNFEWITSLQQYAYYFEVSQYPTMQSALRLQLFLVTSESILLTSDGPYRWVVSLWFLSVLWIFFGVGCRFLRGECDCSSINDQDQGPHKIDNHVEHTEGRICFVCRRSI